MKWLMSYYCIVVYFTKKKENDNRGLFFISLIFLKFLLSKIICWNRRSLYFLYQLKPFMQLHLLTWPGFHHMEGDQKDCIPLVCHTPC